jgi:cytochrome c553
MYRACIWAACAALALLCSSRAVLAWDAPPPWAFAVNPPGSKPIPDDGRPREIPGSAARFTLTQIRDLYHVPDWHPESHPTMPGIVANGPRERAFACGFCHLPNGQGRPENANLAGLPADYIVRQVADFKSGARRSSEGRHLPAALMTSVAEAATEDEVRVAAGYFAALKPRRWIRVVESETAPATHVAGWMLVADAPPAREPIAGRIVEMPEDLERTELRDADSGFVAYVPPGSVARGRGLTESSTAGVAQCTSCHGADLRGLGPVPGLAGRSPSYLVRQLYDMKRGSRRGAWWPLMEAPMAALTDEDIVAIAAYAASLAP